MPKVRKITNLVPQTITRKRVAAYARVSMETEKLMHSLSAQVSYYSSFIQHKPEWEFAGVYVDEGITGTSTKHRDEFKRLIADCRDGKIDMILVKSISRFARDTVDTLKTTRFLKTLGIDVYFEREDIHSLSNEGELLLTLLASFAQEESRSISENIKWSTRKKFEEGIPNGHKAPYGYFWDGEKYRIVHEQGEVVKEIYQRYLQNESAYAIAKSLARRGILGQKGIPLDESTVKLILSSESYTGILILQKNYFSDEHRRRRNKGELPRYAVDGMFEPLVKNEDFEKVQAIRQHRAENAPNASVELTAFSGKVKCGFCGYSVSRRTKNNVKKWVCNTRERKGMHRCDMRPIYEEELEEAAMQALEISEYDESIVKREIRQITIHGDILAFTMSHGKTKEIKRKYGGYKRRSGFSGKLVCGKCGSKCESDTWKLGSGGKKVPQKIWKCKAPACTCGLKRLLDDELRIATETFLGKDGEALFVEMMDKAIIYDNRLDFCYRDGSVKTWQRK